MKLRRRLGLAAVFAVVVGDMIGSGIFFTPDALAAVASRPWQVYGFWALCGVIVLCGALSLAELATLLPRAGVSYHALTSAYGPFAGFMQAWMTVLVGGPGAIAGIAVLFGEFAGQLSGSAGPAVQLSWAAAAIVFFALVNLRGVEWGGRTQVLLTGLKLLGLLALIGGGLFLAAPTPAAAGEVPAALDRQGLVGLAQFVGGGVAVVLFTYDGWIDVSNVAGEVRRPERDLPLALGLGVVAITVVYLLLNAALMRVVPLAEMGSGGVLSASRVAEAAFGPAGAGALNALMLVSIFGALGGLVMTLPRLYYAAASTYVDSSARSAMGPVIRALTYLSPRTAVPAGAILFASGLAIAALLFFGSFSRIVSFFVVPFQFMNILIVASVFRLRQRLPGRRAYRVPAYPLTPLLFVAVMGIFLLSALVYNPLDSLIGIALTLAGVPVYRVLARGTQRHD